MIKIKTLKTAMRKYNWYVLEDTEFEEAIPVIESILIYDKLSKDELCGKFCAISNLYEELVVTKDYYLSDCPLCDKYRDSYDKEEPCRKCPWPSVSIKRFQCENRGPYKKYSDCNTHHENAVWAGHVTKMLLGVLNKMFMEKCTLRKKCLAIALWRI